MTTLFTGIFNKIAQAAGTCEPGGSFFGFPTWYKYLGGKPVEDLDGAIRCVPAIDGLTDIWLIVAAVIDMLLRIAIVIAIGLVVMGGVKYMTSQGMPDKTKAALNTILNAIIGLLISLGAATLVSYVAGRF